MPANAQLEEPQTSTTPGDQLDVGGTQTEPAGPQLLDASKVTAAIEHGQAQHPDKLWIRRYQEAIEADRSGQWDEPTVQRIARFQKKVMKKKPTGKVGPKTHKRLRKHLERSHGLGVLTELEREDARQYNAEQEIDSTAVKKVKKVLGLKQGGRNADEFLEAVGRYQRRNGLKPTGKLTRGTQRRIGRFHKRLTRAIGRNKKSVKERFWVRRYQEAVEVKRTGRWNFETVRRIAEFQQRALKNETPNGVVAGKTKKRLRLHLRRAHGWKKGRMLTRLERRDAKKYNLARDPNKKWMRKYKTLLKVKSGGRGSFGFVEKLARFQRRQKMTPSGKLTKSTRKRLQKAWKKRQGGGVRKKIISEAEATLTTRTGHNYYSLTGALTTNPLAKPPLRSDCSQWVRAVYLRAGAGDPGTWTGDMIGRGKRTSSPAPGDLLISNSHVELYVGKGKTIGHGSPPIDYSTTGYWLGQGFWFLTYPFLGK